MAAGLEPFDAAALVKWLKAKGCTFHHQTGSHQFYTAPNGAQIGTPDAITNHPVTTVNAERVADRMGMRLSDLRKELGHSHLTKSHVTRARLANSKAPVTAPKAIVKIEPLDVLALRGMAEMQAIYRSGPCRKAGYEARSQFAGLISRLGEWHRQQQGVAS